MSAPHLMPSTPLGSRGPIASGLHTENSLTAHALSATTHVASTSLPPTSSFSRILSGLGSELSRSEIAMRGAIGAHPRTLGNEELLALQVGVYRYSELVDLAAKLIDRVQSGVKTVLQGQ